ncbi:MAG TPA: thioredoxin family protein [Flavisolibacter sp.]
MKPFLIYILTMLFMMSGKGQAPTADSVLKEACSKAANQQKKVMVIFHASWCGWCQKMDASLNDPSVKPFFDKNFVITHLTIDEVKNKKQLENPGAEELNKKWGGAEEGIPFWVILDKDGALLATSNDPLGENVGCPATAKEVQYFVQVLKKTTSINSQQLAAVIKRFSRNE